jgi:preprotein translocase subunit YajC
MKEISIEILAIGWILLLSLLAFMVVLVITKTIKAERERKSFIKTIKVGDKVYTIVNNSVSGEVIEILDDSVVMKVIVTKSRVYPK